MPAIVASDGLRERIADEVHTDFVEAELLACENCGRCTVESSLVVTGFSGELVFEKLRTGLDVEPEAGLIAPRDARTSRPPIGLAR